jgi:hypothetical protein
MSAQKVSGDSLPLMLTDTLIFIAEKIIEIFSGNNNEKINTN